MENTWHGFWLLHFTMDNFTSFFLSSADIFQKLAVKFQIIIFDPDQMGHLQMLSTCDKICKFRKASLMLQFSIFEVVPARGEFHCLL